MALKKYSLPSLQNLSLHTLSEHVLTHWRNDYNENDYAEEFLKEVLSHIPRTFHGDLFDLMLDSHVKFLKMNKNLVQSISSLINGFSNSNLSKLHLQCLLHIKTVSTKETEYFQANLVSILPCLGSCLTEICLRRSELDFNRLPFCTDEVLKKIGSTCFKLTSLDVSCNRKVTDEGVVCLIPGEQHNGCPDLIKVMLFQCSVTRYGISALLEGLPQLQFCGFNETGQSLRIVDNRNKLSCKPLELAYLSNLGIGRPSERATGLKYKGLACDSTLVNIISRLCPKLTSLKVRVSDFEVGFLHEITSINNLELVYDLGIPSSPGNNTAQYFLLCGAQFVQLNFKCESFSTYYLTIIGQECRNLKLLYIRSQHFICNQDITKVDMSKCVLTNLEVFKFYNFHLCLIASDIFKYVLHKSFVLRTIIMTMRNSCLSDTYVEELFSSIKTSKITKICIMVPNCRFNHKEPMVLTMLTVETLIGICPELEELGELSMWDVSFTEMEEARSRLQLTNSALVIT